MNRMSYMLLPCGLWMGLFLVAGCKLIKVADTSQVAATGGGGDGCAYFTEELKKLKEKRVNGTPAEKDAYAKAVLVLASQAMAGETADVRNQARNQLLELTDTKTIQDAVRSANKYFGSEDSRLAAVRTLFIDKLDSVQSRASSLDVESMKAYEEYAKGVIDIAKSAKNESLVGKTIGALIDAAAARAGAESPGDDDAKATAVKEAYQELAKSSPEYLSKESIAIEYAASMKGVAEQISNPDLKMALESAMEPYKDASAPGKVGAVQSIEALRSAAIRVALGDEKIKTTQADVKKSSDDALKSIEEADKTIKKVEVEKALKEVADASSDAKRVAEVPSLIDRLYKMIKVPETPIGAKVSRARIVKPKIPH